VRQALALLWEAAADRICGKRLKALLPVLIESMERHGHVRLDPVVRSALLDISAATWLRHEWPMQYAQRVLAVVAGNPGEFIEDLTAFPPARRPITFPNRLPQFSPCRHAQSPRHLLRHPRSAQLMLGSSLREWPMDLRSARAE
jgi:hypothetical protein